MSDSDPILCPDCGWTGVSADLELVDDDYHCPICTRNIEKISPTTFSNADIYQILRGSERTLIEIEENVRDAASRAEESELADSLEALTQEIWSLQQSMTYIKKRCE